MSRKIRWGILSTSAIGEKRVIPAMQASRNGVVTAVASRDLQRAQEYAQRLNIPRAYGSYEALIADPEVDAIYNPLPAGLHAEWSIRCAEAGKPVLCEKPLASNAAEARTMVETFEKRGILFAEALMYRHHPLTKRAKELVDSGAVGELRLLRGTFSVNIAKQDDIRFFKELGGGALGDVGSYCVSVMRTLTGQEPTRVRAFGQFGAGGVDEWLAGVLEFPCGALGYFGCSLRSAFDCSYEVFGSTGRLLVDKGTVPSKESEATLRLWTAAGYQEIVIPPADHYQIMVEDFADALIEGRPPYMSPWEGVRNMEVIDRLLASARE